MNSRFHCALGWLVEEKKIAPHIPVWDRTQRDDETLSSNDFQWDERADGYRCPQGNVLRKRRRTFKDLRTHITKAGTIIYRASQSDCASCPLKARCCPNTPMRKIARSVHDSARDVAREAKRPIFAAPAAESIAAQSSIGDESTSSTIANIETRDHRQQNLDQTSSISTV